MERLVQLAKTKTVHFQLPAEAFGNNDDITIVDARIDSGMMHIIIIIIINILVWCHDDRLEIRAEIGLGKKK